MAVAVCLIIQVAARTLVVLLELAAVRAQLAQVQRKQMRRTTQVCMVLVVAVAAGQVAHQTTGRAAQDFRV